MELVAIVPVAATETFREITRDGEIPRGPLPEHVEIFVQHQRAIREKFLAALVDCVPA